MMLSFKNSHWMLMAVFTLVYAAVLLLTHTAYAQPASLNRPWNASWIAFDDDGRGFGVYHFRKTFSLPQKPASFVVHVSADNRYKLFVNGEMVSHGPARSDLHHWKYETVDIAPLLKQGNNVIAALVWNFGKHRPLAQISHRTAFILKGNSAAEEIVNTDKSWKCVRNEGYQPLRPDLVYTFYAVGPGERIDYHQSFQGWQTEQFDDTPWAQPIVISPGIPKGTFDWHVNWMLEPRTIPAMQLTRQSFKAVRETKGITLPKNFLASAPVTVPPNTTAEILLDQGELTNARTLCWNSVKETTR